MKTVQRGVANGIIIFVLGVLTGVVVLSPLFFLNAPAPQVAASEKPLVTEGVRGTSSLRAAIVTPKPPTLWPTPLPGWSWMTPVVSAPPTACTAAGGVTVVLNDGDNFKIGWEGFTWNAARAELSSGPYVHEIISYRVDLWLWGKGENRDGRYLIYRCGYDKFVIWEKAKLLPLLPTATPTRTPVLTIER